MYLYPVLVRPLLESCIQVWSQHKQKHIDIIERVQRTATKIVPVLRNKPYDERLVALGLMKISRKEI